MDQGGQGPQGRGMNQSDFDAQSVATISSRYRHEN